MNKELERLYTRAKELGACCEALTAIQAAKTWDALCSHERIGNWAIWLASNADDLAPAWKAYKAATAPAWKAYKAATAPAWEAYKAARAPEWEAYEAARETALSSLITAIREHFASEGRIMDNGSHYSKAAKNLKAALTSGAVLETALENYRAAMAHPHAAKGARTPLAEYRQRILSAVHEETRLYRERACAMRKAPDSDIDTILSLVSAANTCAALGLILENVK